MSSSSYRTSPPRSPDQSRLFPSSTATKPSSKRRSPHSMSHLTSLPILSKFPSSDRSSNSNPRLSKSASTQSASKSASNITALSTQLLWSKAPNDPLRDRSNTASTAPTSTFPILLTHRSPSFSIRKSPRSNRTLRTTSISPTSWTTPTIRPISWLKTLSTSIQILWKMKKWLLFPSKLLVRSSTFLPTIFTSPLRRPLISTLLQPSSSLCSL